MKNTIWDDHVFIWLDWLDNNNLMGRTERVSIRRKDIDRGRYLEMSTPAITCNDKALTSSS